MTLKPKVMAIASFGGHWVQLMRLRPAWDDCEVVYVATSKDCKGEVVGYAEENGLETPEFHAIPDANKSTKLKLIAQSLCLVWILLRTRPEVIVSTGAAAGLLALFLGRLMGARTIWVDSIANADKLSLSGSHAGRVADLWLTQWPHLASPKGPSHEGAVL